MAKDLEKLQDKVPAFDLYEAKKVIKKEIGEKQFNNINEIANLSLHLLLKFTSQELKMIMRSNWLL